jgi:hypothetical protein
MNATVTRELTRLLRGGPLAQLLAQHAPYLSRRSDNKLCLRCLDAEAHGEFETIDDWAAHVAAALVEARLAKARR